jgi:hypothetical protein
MLRYSSLILFALVTMVHGQIRALPVERPVLRALPLGGNDDINSKPLPDEQVILSTPPAPTHVVPRTAPIEDKVTPLNTVSQPTPLNVKPTGEDALRLQIFLDQSNFGPGVIDAKPGLFTELAVKSWNEVHGYPVGDWTAANTAARKTIPHPLATALVPEFASAWVDPNLPTKVSLQAKCKLMSYRSLAEFMSERYHCDMPYLVELNGTVKMDNLKVRDSIIVPNRSGIQSRS